MYDIETLVAFDTETRLFAKPGNMCPPLVCGSSASEAHRCLHPIKVETLVAIQMFLTLPNTVITGANIAYDLAVCADEYPTLIPFIFAKYDRCEILDVLIATTLHLIGTGNMRDDGLYDPRTGDYLKNSKGRKAERVSLEIALDLVCGRQDAKINDFWRCRYAILEHVPFCDWPTDAKQYPIDDAVNTLDVAKEIIRRHNAGDWINLHDQANQARAAFALHLTTIRGMRTDPIAITEIKEKLLKQREKQQETFAQTGLLADDKPNKQAIKKRLASAYGASIPCPTCQGGGKVASPKTRNKVNCKACDGTGFDLASIEGLPRTEKGGISAERDTLKECGDSVLEAFAEVSGTDKILNTYLPQLEKGTQHAITFESNVLVASGRTSYTGIIQLLPREGGLRECFIPRDGFYFCSTDYTGLELATLAQCQYWICGKSTLGDALNAGLDAHTSFAASMIGRSYEDMLALIKAGDPTAKAYRQFSKVANFGYPGGMSAVTLVISSRKNGIRFCTILEGAVCGTEKITSYKGKPIPPTCKRCIELSEDLRNNWFKQWPEMRQYFKFVSDNLASSDSILQFVSERIRGGVTFCPASNTLFQGLAADGAKRALWYVTRECFDPSSDLYGSRPCVFVHDEIFSEVPIAKAHAAGYRQSELMVQAMREYTPDVLIHAEPALMTRWFKNAKTVHNQEGRLIPWQP